MKLFILLLISFPLFAETNIDYPKTKYHIESGGEFVGEIDMQYTGDATTVSVLGDFYCEMILGPQAGEVYMLAGNQPDGKYVVMLGNGTVNTKDYLIRRAENNELPECLLIPQAGASRSVKSSCEEHFWITELRPEGSRETFYKLHARIFAPDGSRPR